MFRRSQGSQKNGFYLSAGRTKAVLVRPDSMPAEAADLVSTGAGEEVDVVNLQRLHTQRALHGVVLHLRASEHSMIARLWTGQHSQERDRRSCTH